MGPRASDDHPEELEQTAEWLRAQRPTASALDLDRIKQRARAQARREERKAGRLPSPRRTLSATVGVLALVVGLGGAAAIAGKAPPSSPFHSGSSASSAAHSQYKPGKGCGDKNHRHRGGGECKAVAASTGLGGNSAPPGGNHASGGLHLTGGFPFTGLDLGLIAGVGLAALAAGLALRRLRAHP